MVYTYDVCGKLHGRYPVPTLPRVTFSVEPSAAAAEAAEQPDRILRDLEDITVLADDGSTVELLSSRLSMSTPRFVDVRG